MTEHNHVNFHKRIMISNVIKEIKVSVGWNGEARGVVESER
jgi:hypothetical protein